MTNPSEKVAVEQAITLIDEINERSTSRQFYGIGQTLHAKLCTIRATLVRHRLRTSEPTGVEPVAWRYDWMHHETGQPCHTIGADRIAQKPANWTETLLYAHPPTGVERAQAIPAGVYYSAEGGNFYEAATRQGLGNAFHAKWHPRRGEFPTDAMFALSASPSAESGAGDGGGWIVGNGKFGYGAQWRTWNSGMPGWTYDRAKATRYARREDAEAVHREDEDAWQVMPLAALSTVADQPSRSIQCWTHEIRDPDCPTCRSEDVHAVAEQGEGETGPTARLWECSCGWKTWADDQPDECGRCFRERLEDVTAALSTVAEQGEGEK